MSSFILNLFICSARASSLTTPPQSALIVAFENTYDLSLLANTLSDQGIDATLIIPSTESDIYENLVEVEVLKILEQGESLKPEIKALRLCEQLLTDKKILKKVQELQPTFTIFPAIRHDGCLIPWAKAIRSIPVIYTLGLNDELYTFIQTRSAIPINTDGFIMSMISNIDGKFFISSIRSNYVDPALNLVSKYLPEVDVKFDNLYNDVELILWGSDTVLRSNFAPLTQLLVEVGCYHCRGVQPLPPTLQKELIDFRLGTIVSMLEASYSPIIEEIAKKLPQGRQGQAIVWKCKNFSIEAKPENLFLHGDVDRQDLMGYPRTRVLLSHCSDTELLESAFHGTPVICFPRNPAEYKNAMRVLELGFAYSTQGDFSPEKVLLAINQIHNSPEYRENARKVSLAVRDRPIPAMDRLIYWLQYVGRIKTQGENLLLPPKNVNTYAETLQFISGIAIGTLFSVFVTMLYFLLRFVTSKEYQQKSKGKYKR